MRLKNTQEWVCYFGRLNSTLALEKRRIMKMEEFTTSMMQTGEETIKKVNHFAKLERCIAAVLVFTPAILYLADLGYRTEFRDSISNYFFMCESHWFGSLIALAGALFIFNGAQHMSVQYLGDQYISLNSDKTWKDIESRFGKGYNIVFGVALLGLLYFDHINHKIVHYIFAVLFFVGCALAMILTKETKLKRFGDILGVLTLFSLGVHFVLEYFSEEGQNPYTLLFAEWAGLILIAIYFIAESIQRDKLQKEEGLV